MTWNTSKNKYGNKKIERFGKIYDSQLEADDALWLHTLEKQGKIENLEEQVRFQIVVNGISIGYSRVDFKFMYHGITVWYETKGFPTDVYKIKRRCIEAILHGKEDEVYIVNAKDLLRFFKEY